MEQSNVQALAWNQVLGKKLWDKDEYVKVHRCVILRMCWAMAWHWAEGEVELCCSHYKDLTLSQGVSEAGMTPQSCLTLRQGASVHNAHHCLHDSGHDPGLGISLPLRGILGEGRSWKCKFWEKPLVSASVLRRALGSHCSIHTAHCASYNTSWGQLLQNAG